MAGPLLETKLHVPRRRRGLVARPRLSERQSRGAESALTLVSAPAGFGKTTLLAEWLAAAAADGRSAAWLSLDQRDNDPALFWTYLIRRRQSVPRRARLRHPPGCRSTPSTTSAADRSVG
jgi:LuxR family maltose regulon positive regulatory protein